MAANEINNVCGDHTKFVIFLPVQSQRGRIFLNGKLIPNIYISA